jgi:hypothetical protein
MEGERRDWKGIAGAMELIAGVAADVGMRPLMVAIKARLPSWIGAERRMSGVGGRTVHYTGVDAYALLLRSSRDIVRHASGKKLSEEEVYEANHYAKELKYPKGH